MTAQILTQSHLKEILHYCPDTGVFTWRIRNKSSFPNDRSANSWNSKYAGTEAGSYRRDGYKGTIILGKHYLLHRLAWMYVHGSFPDAIDHINHVKDDNRLVNIRSANYDINSRNSSMRKCNKSGCTGVSWHKAAKKWRVQIVGDIERIRMDFSSLQKAIAVRKACESAFGYHENHGK